MAKCTLKVNTTDKEKIFECTSYGIECKTKGDYTYLWYYTKTVANDDKRSLTEEGFECELLDGWDVDGFATLHLH